MRILLRADRCGRRGLSLLETAIAMAIFAVAMLGILGMLLRVGIHNEAANDASLAQDACQDMMEKLMSMSFDDMRGFYDTALVARRRCAFRAKYIDSRVETGSVLIEAVDPDAVRDADPTNDLGGDGSFVRITVAVDGTPAGKPVKVALVMFRSNEVPIPPLPPPPPPVVIPPAPPAPKPPPKVIPPKAPPVRKPPARPPPPPPPPKPRKPGPGKAVL
ncbi:MAG: prepilin-type N-terminal cleavage/methylation domain-containing protein [Planctomycetes bacterium]|nr:prepilin-type N-terminal cleavage/methylation domain-containing protein [Planctomycetota bacterium]